MVKWEYMVEQWQASDGEFVEWLNGYGGEGWELVLSEGSEVPVPTAQVLFKRFIDEETA